jgi:hypothetical protein
MDAEFSLTNYVIAAQVADAAHDGNGVGLDQSTDDYIALIRKYAKGLGDKEVRRRLTDVANEVEPYCPLCASRLDRERENY